MSSESELQELSTVAYWDRRYQDFGSSSRSFRSQDEGQANVHNAEEYEWFRTFEEIQPFLVSQLPAPTSLCRLLHLGNGTSTLPNDLRNLGYDNQLCVDFSAVAMEKMRLEHGDSASLRWLVTDVRDMPGVESSSIDVAIDKGTLDAMIYGSVWNPPPEVQTDIKLYIDEIMRVLAPGGKFLYITFRQPHFQNPFLAREDSWRLEVFPLNTVAGSFEYFGYVMTKHTTAAHGVLEGL